MFKLKKKMFKKKNGKMYAEESVYQKEMKMRTIFHVLM